MLYKCISKSLFHRVKGLLSKIIMPTQYAFINNRLVLHNILIGMDLLRHYKRKHVFFRCIIKVNLRKAYDTINWNFIMDMLKGLWFPSWKGLKFNHLTFSDDYWCYTELISWTMKALKHFYNCSSLEANMSKSRIFLT